MDRIIDRAAPCARQVSYALRASAAFLPLRRAIARLPDDRLADLAGDNGGRAQREAARDLVERELAAAVGVELLPGGLGRLVGLLADEAAAQIVSRVNEDFGAWLQAHWPEAEWMEEAA